MKKNLNLLNSDNWKSLSQKPLLYVGFHEKDGSNYIVAATQKELLFVQNFNIDKQTRNSALEELKNFAEDVPVMINQLKTKSWFDKFVHTML